MAKKKKASYSVKLRGAKGFAQLRYAKTFEIWYGKKKILGPVEFPRNKKKVAERKLYLERKAKGIERDRLKVVAEHALRRELAKKKREKAKKAKVKPATPKQKRQKEKIKKIVAKKPLMTDEDAEEFSYSRGQLNKEVLDFDHLRGERPITLKNATIHDVIVIPIKPINDTYEKEQVEKIITRHGLSETLILSICNFSLTPDYLVPMELSTFNESYDRCSALMLLHVLGFYSEVQASTDAWILRIKYSYEKSGSEYFQESGISMPRTAGIENRKDMIDQWRWTFRKFLGLVKNASRNRPLGKNYLAGENLIYITGFNLEATTYG